MNKRTQKVTPGNGATTGAVVKKLAPGVPGTLRHVARHGDALVCVRYREDRARRQRLTTVELIVDTRPMKADAQLAYVRIAWGEVELSRQVKAAGGAWDATRKLWRLPAPAVRTLKLADRVVAEDS